MQLHQIIYTDPATLDTKELKASFNENVITKNLPKYKRAYGKINVTVKTISNK